jgi:hypothetical protein
MVFSASFNTISAISWLSVLLVEESGVVLKTNEITSTLHVMFQLKKAYLEEKFGDTKEVIRINKPKKDRQRNGRKKKDRQQMAERIRTDNTMAEKRRTDNTMTEKRKRDNTMAER